MTTLIRILIIVLIILAVLAFLGYLWGKNGWSKISFSAPDIQQLDLTGLSLTNLSSGNAVITPTLSMIITNDNGFSIPISGLKVVLTYNGVIIAQTSDALQQQKIIVPAHGNYVLQDTININVNNAAPFLIEKIQGNHPSVNYAVDITVFGIPIGRLFPIKDSFTW